jgi:predicted ATP-dependent serine protease
MAIRQDAFDLMGQCPQCQTWSTWDNKEAMYCAYCKETVKPAGQPARIPKESND